MCLASRSIGICRALSGRASNQCLPGTVSTKGRAAPTRVSLITVNVQLFPVRAYCSLPLARSLLSFRRKL
jgi:hypothetical protein